MEGEKAIKMRNSANLTFQNTKNFKYNFAEETHLMSSMGQDNNYTTG